MSAAPVPRHPAETRSLPPETVRTAIDWMLRLQSRERDLHGRQALQARCREWRDGHPDHELAWQRLTGLSRDLRSSTVALPAPAARQLLSVVNGYTPLAHLVRRLQAEHGPHATQAAVQHLMARGYIKPIAPPCTSLPSTAQWHWDDDEQRIHAC